MGHTKTAWHHRRHELDLQMQAHPLSAAHTTLPHQHIQLQAQNTLTLHPLALQLLACLPPGSSPAALLTSPLSPLPLQEAKKLLEDKFKTGKNRWFFSKLRF
jgi:hypothetical protein